MRILNHLLLAFSLVLTAAPLAQAKEPFVEFFDGLIDRGYYEQAIWYVESASNNPDLPDDIKQTLLYRKGLAQIEAARHMGNLDQRTNMLSEAANNLAEFLKKHPNSNRAIDALIQRGNVLADQGRLAQIFAKQESNDAAKEPLLKQSREKYGQARKVFEDAHAQIREALSSLGTVLDPSKDADKIAFRDEMRASYIQTQMLASNCLLESAKTLDDESDERKKQLEQAAKEFGETYSKYKSRLAGLYARLYEAQAQQALGKDKEALAIYQDDLMLLPDQPQQFRVVKLKAAIGLATIWLSQDGATKVVNELAPWLVEQQLRPHELRDPEWLEFRLLIAKAYLKESEALEPKDKLKGEYKTTALKLAVDIAKYPGDTQKPAIELRSQLQGNDAVAQDKPEPKTFQEAVTAGRDLVTEANAQNFAVTKMKESLASIQEEAAKNELAAQIEADQQSIDASFEKAKAYFQQALLLADRETPRDEVNNVHYFLSFLSFQAGQYWQTYVRASFISEHFPNSSSARPCTKMALACALRLFETAPPESRSFELSLVKRTTDFMVRQWPESEEAGQAQLALIGLQLQQAGSKELSWPQQKQLVDQADSTVSKMMDGSSSKADAQLKVGQTYWNLFLRGNTLRRQAASDNADAASVPSEEDLATIQQKAEAILASGVNSYQADNADYTYVLGALSLAQVYTDTGQPQKAVELLEKPKLGLISLLEAKNPNATRPGIDQLIYRAAVKAYVSALPTSQDAAQSEELMGKAENAMDQLKSLAGNNADSQKQLIAIYISLANDLKQQLDNADPATKQTLASAFESFLNRVGESSSEPNVLNWVGETFYNLGLSFKEDPNFMGNADQFYTKAIAAYQRILDSANSEKVNPALLQQVRVRVAMAQRETGKYEEALKTFTDVLTQSNMMVNVQVEAAKTYYEWGLHGGTSKAFHQAIMGAEVNPQTKQNVIWGWGRLQKVLSRYANKDAEPSPYKDVFYESRYNLALARYQFALAQKDAEKKKQYLAMAARDITSTQLFDPGLGGDEWWSKFDSLMRKIQKDLSGTAQGLEKK